MDFSQRKQILKQHELEWSWIVSKPKLSFYRMFKSGFAFLPLEYRRSTLESLLMQTDSGLFDSLELSPKEQNLSYDEFLKFHKLKNLKPKTLNSKSISGCFPKENTEKICLLKSEMGATEGIEIFNENNHAPSLAFYFNPAGELHTFISHELETFLAFDQNQ